MELKASNALPSDPYSKSFGKENGGQQALCICHHRFILFIAAFLSIQFLYSAAMPKVDIINCNTKGVIKAYPFALFMSNESTIAGNISVFEDLTIQQLGLDKDDSHFNELLTLWWGDLKTEVLILRMKRLGVRSKRAYDRYEYLFPGLALWHLCFNYLKMIKEIFYLGNTTSERSTLQ